MLVLSINLEKKKKPQLKSLIHDPLNSTRYPINNKLLRVSELFFIYFFTSVITGLPANFNIYIINLQDTDNIRYKVRVPPVPSSGYRSLPAESWTDIILHESRWILSEYIAWADHRRRDEMSIAMHDTVGRSSRRRRRSSSCGHEYY